MRGLGILVVVSILAAATAATPNHSHNRRHHHHHEDDDDYSDGLCPGGTFLGDVCPDNARLVMNQLIAATARTSPRLVALIFASGEDAVIKLATVCNSTHGLDGAVDECYSPAALATIGLGSQLQDLLRHCDLVTFSRPSTQKPYNKYTFVANGPLGVVVLSQRTGLFTGCVLCANVSNGAECSGFGQVAVMLYQKDALTQQTISAV
jgi:hypothetical protein